MQIRSLSSVVLMSPNTKKNLNHDLIYYARGMTNSAVTELVTDVGKEAVLDWMDVL